MRKVVRVEGLLMVGLVVTPGLWSHAELAKAVGEAKVSLEQGLSISAHEGKPISAKFEIEDGSCSCRSIRPRAIRFRRWLSTTRQERLPRPNRSRVVKTSARQRRKAK